MGRRVKTIAQHIKRFGLSHFIETGTFKGDTSAAIAELGIKVTDVTNYLAFARREFRRLLLEQLRELTSSDEEFEAESRTLLGSSH